MENSQTFKPLDKERHPPYLYPGYQSTVTRSPTRPLIPLRQSLAELTGPVYSRDAVHPLDNDLTRNAVKNAAPHGQRIIVTGYVLDDTGRPVPNALVEIWQANAAGRYLHHNDQHDAPLDPICNSIPDEAARQSLIATYDHEITQPDWALGYRFDMIVCGPRITPFE